MVQSIFLAVLGLSHNTVVPSAGQKCSVVSNCCSAFLEIKYDQLPFKTVTQPRRTSNLQEKYPIYTNRHMMLLPSFSWWWFCAQQAYSNIKKCTCKNDANDSISMIKV